jgi:hypothetical protein
MERILEIHLADPTQIIDVAKEYIIYKEFTKNGVRINK